MLTLSTEKQTQIWKKNPDFNNCDFVIVLEENMCWVIWLATERRMDS